MLIALAIGIVIAVFIFILGMFLLGDDKNAIGNIVAVAIVVGLLVFLGISCIHTVDAGNVGIKKTFGKTAPDIAMPGLVFTAPWTSVIPFNVQQHESFQPITGGSRDQVMYSANVAFIYQVDPNYAVWVYNEIGNNYENVAITSNVRDACREVLGNYNAMYSYAEGREDVSKALYSKLVPVFAERHLILLNVNFREYDIPEEIKSAAATKKATEQQIETARAKIDIKKMEAQALVEEGKGIAEYQKIVSEGINEQLIKWRGQEKLAEAASHGNTILVVTDGEATLPYMVNAK